MIVLIVLFWLTVWAALMAIGNYYDSDIAILAAIAWIGFGVMLYERNQD